MHALVGKRAGRGVIGYPKLLARSQQALTAAGADWALPNVPHHPTPRAAQYDVMITAGANQAFTNVVLSLLDADDCVVLFK